jgi:hypothetical protein
MTRQNPVCLVNEGGNREREFLHAPGKLADLLFGMGPQVFGRGPEVLDRHELENVRQLGLGNPELSIGIDGLVGFMRRLTVLGHGSFLARTLMRKAHFGLRFWMLPIPAPGGWRLFESFMKQLASWRSPGHRFRQFVTHV